MQTTTMIVESITLEDMKNLERAIVLQIQILKATSRFLNRKIKELPRSGSKTEQDKFAEQLCIEQDDQITHQICEIMDCAYNVQIGIAEFNKYMPRD